MEISGNIKKGKKIASTDQSFYNYASWLSLKRKGHLMLEHYKNEIMPLIKRVESIQRRVELPNDDGDVYIGYIDFEAEIEGYDGIITLDNKTSSRPYKITDIQDKGQLLGYDEFTENGKGGYIVLHKKIKYHKSLTCQDCGEVTRRAVKSCPAEIDKKRCGGELDLEKIPYVKHQILVDDIDSEKKDLLFDEICDILAMIENEEFDQDRTKCGKDCHFGKQCIYYNFCRSNPAKPDITGLARHGKG